ncbi:MAG: TetR/AcrR family transcriptional regulator [Leucobacter sp.]
MSAHRPRRRPGENRKFLLEAGLVEFGLSGFYGASTTAIARRAGVPQPHLYANFATKLQLFAACCDQVASEFSGASSGGEDPPQSHAHATFVLQAVSVLHDGDLRPSAAALVTAVRSVVGEHGLSRLLMDAAEELLAGEDR